MDEYIDDFAILSEGFVSTSALFQPYQKTDTKRHCVMKSRIGQRESQVQRTSNQKGVMLSTKPELQNWRKCPNANEKYGNPQIWHHWTQPLGF